MKRNSEKTDVVSLFFLGTNQHRDTYEGALTTFHHAVENFSKDSYGVVKTRLFDGVGSKPTKSKTLHPTPGRYIYNPEAENENDQKIKLDQGLTPGFDDFMKRVTGCLAGDGVDELIFESIQYIEKIIKDNDGYLPKVVNLHGYSRGADTCVRLANLLDSLYPEIEVNLFLTDQVAGHKRKNDKTSYTIPKNVKHMETQVMLHEYNPGFDPQHRNSYVFASPKTTKVNIKEFPGYHESATVQTGYKPTNHVARLTHDDFFKFAKKTGSLGGEIPPPCILRINNQYTKQHVDVLSDAERFANYNEMKQSWSSYATRKMHIHTRDPLKNRQHVQGNSFFVNQEHRELFEKLYPSLAQYFFYGKQIEHSYIRYELTCLQEKNPNFHKLFKAKFGIESTLVLPGPRRVPQFNHAKSGEVLVNDDNTSALKHKILSVINYEKYHEKSNNPKILKNIEILTEALQTCSLSTGDDHFTLNFAINQVCHNLNNEGLGSSFMCKKLSGSLKNFTPTLFHQKSTDETLAAVISKKFRAYEKRNSFWEGVQQFLSHFIPIKLPEFVSSKKSTQANSVCKELNQLADKNNAEAINNILQKAHNSTYNEYTTLGKLKKGLFDQIMDESLHLVQREEFEPSVSPRVC